MLDEVVVLMTERNKLHKVANIDKDLLKELITFLEEFQKATLALKKFKEPTLHRVIYWQHRFSLHLIIQNDNVDGHQVDSSHIAIIKDLMHPIFEDKFEIETIHIVAALLDPAQKHRIDMFGVESTDIDWGRSALKSYMTAIGRMRADDNNVDGVPLPPPSKKARIAAERQPVLSMYLDDKIEDGNGHDDDKENLILPNIDAMIDIEFDKYIAYKVDKSKRTIVYVEHVRVA